MTSDERLAVGIVEDYELVVLGVRDMLAAYSERLTLVELDADREVDDLDRLVDIVLVDPHGPHLGVQTVERLLRATRRAHVVIFSWTFDATSVERASRTGTQGYLSKALRAAELVEALEDIRAGDFIAKGPARAAEPPGALHRARSGVAISEREADVLRLIMQGRSNAEVAEAARLSANTVKSYIRSLYRKIGVSTRSQAVVWGLNNSLTVTLSPRRPALSPETSDRLAGLQLDPGPSRQVPRPSRPGALTPEGRKRSVPEPCPTC